MVLRGRRIDKFVELWCLVASGGLGIWVSSTSFQKSNIGWPQQPLTEKVLNFNMIFHDPTKKLFFSKHQNKAEFKNLDDTEVLSSDFPDLRTSAASFHQNKITDSDGWIISGTKMTNNSLYWSLFVEWIIKNPIFH